MSSSPIDLNLDFQDYTPANEQVNDATNAPRASARDQPVVQIKIPDAVGQPPETTRTSSDSGKLFQGLLQGSGNAPPSAMSEESLRQLLWASQRLRPQQPRPQPTGGGFSWGLNYFSQYFDLDTSEVLERIIWSAIPLRKTGFDIEDSELMAPLAGGPSESGLGDDNVSLSAARHRRYSYVERFIQSRPDFYGPFWISTTLMFAVAIFSNIASYVNFKSKVETVNDSNGSNLTNNQAGDMASGQSSLDIDRWHYSIDELNIMSSMIMLYVMLVPTVIWFVFWFRGCNKYYTLTETICAYGYSLSIFIPLSVLLMVQAPLFRYLVMALASTLSGAVLTLSFLPIAESDPQPGGSHIILAIVPLCHFGLAYVIHRTMLL